MTRKTKGLIVIFILCSCSVIKVFAAFPKEVPMLWGDILRTSWKKNYIETIEKIKNSRLKYQKNESVINMLDQQYLTILSLSGEYNQLDSIRLDWDEIQWPQDLESFKIASAKKVILKLANKTQIVMFNEAHHISRHRTLTLDLLSELKKIGYQYLAVEGLNLDDNLISHEGFPTTKSGIYVNETIYAQLLREAKKIGMNIIAYDSDSDTRELDSAKNLINKSFGLDVNAKVIVHSGYGHIFENKTMLAARLHDLTGIDPLTINQTEFMETEISDLPEILLKTSDLLPREALVLLDEHEIVYSSAKDKYDMNVIWRPSNFVNGRPEWYFSNFKSVAFESKWCDFKFPCLVEISLSKLGDQSVPLDRLIVKDSGEYFLRSNCEDFTIRTYDAKGIEIKTLSKKGLDCGK